MFSGFIYTHIYFFSLLIVYLLPLTHTGWFFFFHLFYIPVPPCTGAFVQGLKK